MPDLCQQVCRLCRKIVPAYWSGETSMPTVRRKDKRWQAMVRKGTTPPQYASVRTRAEAEAWAAEVERKIGWDSEGRLERADSACTSKSGITARDRASVGTS